MSAREAIFGRLRAKSRKVTHPPAWQSEREFDDLAERFCEWIVAAKGEVRRAPSLDAAWNEVAAILEEVQARSVVANDESPLNEIALAERFAGYEWHIVGKTEGDLRQRNLI